MPICPKCHSNVKEGQKFCNVCGTNVPTEGTGSVSSGPVKVFCEQCGRELNRAMKFCKYCGAQQKNFADPTSRGTEVITTPAVPTADMQPETANQSATEVISQPVNYPPPQVTGPAGPSHPTQVMNEATRPSTEPIHDDRTGGFPGTTGVVQGSAPIERGYSTGETFRPAAEQSTEYFTHDLRSDPSGPFYSTGAPTSIVTPSKELEEKLPTTDKFGTITDQPTAPVSTTGPRVNPSGPTTPPYAPTAPVNTAPHVTPSGPTPSLPPTASMGTQPFNTYVPTPEPTQQTRTVPLPGDQPAYSTMPPPTTPVQQKKKGAGLLVGIAAVLVLLLGGGALGGYYLYTRNHNNDNNGPIGQNGGGPTNPGGNQPSSGGDSGGQPNGGGSLPTPNPNNPNNPNTPNKPDDKNKDAGKDKAGQQPNNPNGGQSAEEQRKAEEARRAEEQKKLDDQKRAADEQAKRDQQARDEQARRDEEQRKIEEQKRIDEQKKIEDEKRRQAEANVPRSGRVFWAANIQGEGQYNIIIRGGSASTQTVVGPSIEGASVQFSNSIPQRAMRIVLGDIRGGRARVVQSPGPSNGYVTIIQVQGKNQRVSFTLSWDLL